MQWCSRCLAEKTDFEGWDAVRLRNGLVDLVAVPDIGGRIMAYNVAGYPLLWLNEELAGKLFTPEENQGDGSLAAWKNYGGDKTWPAPQGWANDDQWHGPPDPILDTGRYRLDKLAASPDMAVFSMTSPPDPRTGVQITRQAALSRGSTRVTLTLTFTNTVQRRICWSIWDVVQLRAERTLPDGTSAHEPECTVTVPLNPSSRFPNGFNVMFGDSANPQWQIDHAAGLFVGRYLWEIGKVGLDSPAGWIAFSNSATGYAFTERFEVFPDAHYPDDGATVECWTVGRGQVADLNYEGSGIFLMETEVLSPLHAMEPGESCSFTIEWGACRCPGPVVDVTAAGCAGRRLTAQRNRDYVRLVGSFGVFDAGDLILTWMDTSGNILEEEGLGSADPLAVLVVDRVLPAPERAAQAQLWVQPGAGGVRLLLAEVAF